MIKYILVVIFLFGGCKTEEEQEQYDTHYRFNILETFKMFKSDYKMSYIIQDKVTMECYLFRRAGHGMSLANHSCSK